MHSQLFVLTPDLGIFYFDMLRKFAIYSEMYIIFIKFTKIIVVFA
jgi:hypothetical protein